ncbi:MAG: YfhO family protein, partial [Acidobacteria bacterium]|nr:YfhO family protein [Acidobacteriota bacterium]
RLVWVGLIALAVTAFELAPLLRDAAIVNQSRWEAVWKWDSFGLNQVLKLLLTGDLLDYGRLPVLSLLALAGVLSSIGVVWPRLGGNKWRLDPSSSSPQGKEAETGRVIHTFLLSGAILWLFLFCGKPAWGGTLFRLLGLSDQLQLHRLIGGVHVFLIFLAGIGLFKFWSLLSRQRWRARPLVPVSLATFLILYPALLDRINYARQSGEWGRQNLDLYQREANALNQVVAQVKGRYGRAYAGLAAGWGGQFRVGWVPIYSFLAENHVPAVAFLYHAMALTGDIMVRFNEFHAPHYRLFNITSVIAPPNQSLPPFLTPLNQAGRFRLLSAPASGYFDLVSVPFAVRCDRKRFYDINDPWLASDWVAKQQHLLLDLDGDAPAHLPRLPPAAPLPATSAAAGLGTIETERQDGAFYRAQAQVARDCYLLFKMTYHPNWRAAVDGKPQKTVMLSPGFVGVALSPGRHTVEWHYQPESWKTLLLFLGAALLAVAIAAERAGYVQRAEDALNRRIAGFGKSGLPGLNQEVAATVEKTGDPGKRRAERVSPAAGSAVAEPALAPQRDLGRWSAALALAALSLPLCLPLLTGAQPAGHDAFEYMPRAVEFHENIRHGVLLPRWAPDLSSGFGQPLFLFNPPLLYYLAELCHLAGADFMFAVNLACLIVIAASGWTMFLLGSLYFGRAGGLLAATAYLYAPYFHLDLYVRQALAEFVAFPFYPLALYGFGRYVRERRKEFLLVGAAGYAAVLASHNPAALLFTPLLAGFVIFNAWQAGSWRFLRDQSAGFLLGLGLAAFIWLPILTEKNFINVDRLLEDYLRYANHFVYPKQLIFPAWGYGISLPGDQDGMSFSLGWSHLILIGGVWLWARRCAVRFDQRLVLFMAAAAGALCVVMTPASRWLWDRLLLLQYVEFPWRLLAPTSVCVALVIAPLGRALMAGGHGTRRLACALALLVLPNLSHAQPSRYFDLEPAEWTPAQIARRGIAVTTKEEYEPKWVTRRSLFRPEPLRVISGSAQVLQANRTPVRWTAEVRVAQQAALELSNSYYPGWKVLVDGLDVPVGIAQGSGLMQINIPPGVHRILVQFHRTGTRWLGDFASLLSLLVMAGLWRKWRRVRMKEEIQLSGAKVD